MESNANSEVTCCVMQHGQRIAMFVTVGNDIVNGLIVVARGPSIGLPIARSAMAFSLKGETCCTGAANRAPSSKSGGPKLV